MISWALIGTWATEKVGTLPGWENGEEEKREVWKMVGEPSLRVIERGVEVGNGGAKDGGVEKR